MTVRTRFQSSVEADNLFTQGGQRSVDSSNANQFVASTVARAADPVLSLGRNAIDVRSLRGADSSEWPDETSTQPSPAGVRQAYMLASVDNKPIWLPPSAIESLTDTFVQKSGDHMTGRLEGDGEFSTTGDPAWRLWQSSGGAGILSLGDGVSPMGTMPPSGTTNEFSMSHDAPRVAGLRVGHKLRDYSDPVDASDLSRKSYVDTKIPKSLGTAKGDLIGFSADNTPVKIPAAASDGYGLTSDSSQSGGVAWKSPAARYKVGTFACPGSTGSLAITGLGFKPGLVEFHSDWGNIANYSLVGSGAADGSGGMWAVSDWVSAPPGTSSHYSTTSYCVYLADPSGATIYLASLTSMDAGGFTLNFTSVNASGLIRWIAHA